MWKIKTENEVYIFFNGQLIYKKWLNTNKSLIFDSFGLPWNPRRKEPDLKQEDLDQTKMYFYDLRS